MSLKSALEKIKTEIDDLMSLEVQTYTGDIQAMVTGEDISNFDTILEKAVTEGDSKVQLVLHTKVKLDGDTTIYFQKGEIPEHALATHTAALKAGTETRQGILTLFKDLIT